MFLIIIYQSDSRNAIQISAKDGGKYRLWGARGGKWKECEAMPNDIPNILLFIRQFEALAETIIENI